MRTQSQDRTAPMEEVEVHEGLVERLLALNRVEVFQIMVVLVLITYVRLLITYKVLILRVLNLCQA